MRLWQHNPNWRIAPVLQITTQEPYQTYRQDLFCLPAIVKYFDRLTMWDEVWLRSW